MKKTLFCFAIFYLTCTLAFTQTKKIYDVGQPVVTCEDNFENLFKSWNSNTISNAEDTKLLNYVFIETITTSEDIKKYAERTINKESMIPSVKHSKASENGKTLHSSVFVNLNKVESLFNAAEAVGKESLLETEIKNFRNLFEKKVSIGDNVYIVILEYKSEIYFNYVICSGENHKVIFDNIFLNVTVNVAI